MNSLWLALIVAQAQPQQFNLVCSGAMRSMSEFGERSASYQYHYRVDLRSGQFCTEACTVLRDIVEVQPALLVLERSGQTDLVLGPRQTTNTINRQTGAQTISSQSYGSGALMMVEWTGHCEASAFTGFPDVRTRF